MISLEEYRKLPADRGVSGSESVYWAVSVAVSRPVFNAFDREFER